MSFPVFVAVCAAAAGLFYLGLRREYRKQDDVAVQAIFFGGAAAAAFALTEYGPDAAWVRVIGITVSLLAVFFGAYVIVVGARVARWMARLLSVLAPLIAIGIALVALTSSLYADADDTLLPAMIAAITVALGWVAGPITQEMRRSDERNERRRDIIEASANEIWLIAKFAASLNVKETKQKMRAAFARDNRYAVFVFYRREFGTLRRLVDEIESLRQDQIEPVMGLYQLLHQLDQMEAAMESADFKALPRPRREAGVMRYYDVLATVPEQAVEALTALERPSYADKLLAHIEAEIAKHQRKMDA